MQAKIVCALLFGAILIASSFGSSDACNRCGVRSCGGCGHGLSVAAPIGLAGIGGIGCGHGHGHGHGYGLGHGFGHGFGHGISPLSIATSAIAAPLSIASAAIPAIAPAISYGGIGGGCGPEVNLAVVSEPNTCGGCGGFYSGPAYLPRRYCGNCIRRKLYRLSDSCNSYC